jgi:hypothetical protein
MGRTGSVKIKDFFNAKKLSFFIFFAACFGVLLLRGENTNARR